LSRPSTPFSLKGRNKDVDARDKRGHDVERWFDLIGTRSRLPEKRQGDLVSAKIPEVLGIYRRSI